MPGELTEKGFVFLDNENRPFWCAMWGGSPWLFYWHPDKNWVSHRKVNQTEIWLFPQNLKPKEQALYFKDNHMKKFWSEELLLLNNDDKKEVTNNNLPCGVNRELCPMMEKLKAADKVVRLLDDLIVSNTINSRSAIADARLLYGEPHEYNYNRKTKS